MAQSPQPSPSPVTCLQVLHKCGEVVTAKNKQISDLKQITKDQTELNLSLKGENLELRKNYDRSRIILFIGVCSGIVLGFLAGRSSH